MAMTEPLKWKEFMPTDRPYHLPDGDKCYYAREYKSHGGFEAGECNNLILNLKKKPSLRGTPQWGYKVGAIQRFARELAPLLADNAVVAAIPTSKTNDHADYDSRLEDVITALIRLKPHIR